MSNNFSRVPVHMVPSNEHLMKGMYASAPNQTTYVQTETVPEVGPREQYRYPLGRENGNEIFRRYPNGDLDIDYAKNVVVDAIHIACDHGPLNSVQKVALGCIFPEIFLFVDPNMADSMLRTTLRVSPLEHMLLVEAVAHHLHLEHQYMLSCHAR